MLLHLFNSMQAQFSSIIILRDSARQTQAVETFPYMCELRKGGARLAPLDWLTACFMSSESQRGYISKLSDRMVGWGWMVLSFLDSVHVGLNQNLKQVIELAMAFSPS